MRFQPKVKCTRGIVAMVAAMTIVGCSTGSTATDGSGDFDSYVPGATPAMPAAPAVDTREALEPVAGEVIRLGAILQGNPNRFQIAVASDGRVFALDVMDGRLHGYHPDGAPLEWGTYGDGSLILDPPPLALAADADNLVLADSVALRVVNPDGVTVKEVATETTPWGMSALGDDTYVAQQVETGVVGRYSFDGEEIARYTVFTFPDEILGGELRLWPQQQFVVGVERVFVTTAERYEVTAFQVDGGSAWVLRGDGEPVPIPEHLTGRTLGRNRRAGRAAGATIDEEYANVRWPDVYPALSSIATDARDRLYVFPYVVDQDTVRFPVDVYSSDGTFLLSATLPFQGWNAFAGDSIYRLEVRDGQHVVVRYQLDLPSAPVGSSAGQ